MHTFIQYLKESAGAESNSKGVFHELETLRHLNGGKHATHHPNEEGLTPAQAHHHHGAALGHELAHNIGKHSAETARVVREHLHKIGFLKTKTEPLKGTWTSKAGQVHRVTGHAADKTNPSDYVLTNKRGHHIGVSAKIGEKPGLRSPGLKDLDKLTKAPSLEHHITTHKNKLVKMMGHHVSAGAGQEQRNKEFRAAESGAGHKQAEAVKAESLAFRTKMAKHYAKHFNALSHEEKHHAVRRLLNAEQAGTHYIKTHVDDRTGHIHVSDPVAEFHHMHKKMSHYSAEHSGTYMKIHAHDKAGKSYHIANLNLKDKSSPMTNITGAVSAAKDYHKAVA
jgi:hypothetical protein